MPVRPHAVPWRALPFFYDLYTFRGDGGSTTVVASFAVPVGRLNREKVDGDYRYRFNVSLVLADTAFGGVSRTDDSVFVARDRPLDDDHLLHTYIETEARPSSTTVQRVIMIDAPNPGTGQLYTHPFVIPDYSGSRLMLSDIALGLPGGVDGWRRGDATLALLPSNDFPSGTFDVFYEVYNLPKDHRYTTEVSFAPIDAAGRPRAHERVVRVSFTGQAASDAGGLLRELRRVDAPLDEGYYRLVVRVTDAEDGREATRTRVLRVRDWKEGATMVAACPVLPGASCRTVASRP